MFVSIDMDNLVFLHKHADHETISAISFLEAADRSIRVDHYLDRTRFLVGVSDLDINMLYRNTAGKPLPPGNDTMALRYQLADLAHLMPITRALRDEVLSQVDAVEDRLYAGERFSYALGATTPAQPGELFPLKSPRPLTEKELTEAIAHSRSPVRGYPPRLTGQPWLKDRDEQSVVPPAYESATPAMQPAQRDMVSSTKKPRATAVRPVVRAAADKAWEAAGKPTDLAALKQLTVALIPDLEAQSFHPTTIRIKLSEWVKEHAA